MGLDEKKYKACLDQFKRDLEDLDYEGSMPLDLKSLARNLVENNLSEFSFLFSKRPETQKRKIERIYSRNEIRHLVCGHLISQYQHDQIIDAVTDFLYGMHAD